MCHIESILANLLLQTPMTGVKNGTAENSEGKKCHIVKQPPEYHIADINFSGMT